MKMRKTKVFRSGNSWAVRLPKGFDLAPGFVMIFRQGDDFVIRKIPINLAEAIRQLPKLPGEFMPEGIKDPLPQTRKFEWR